MNPNDKTVEFTQDDKTYVLEYRDADHSYWLGAYGTRRQRLVSVSTLAKVCYSDPGGLMNYAWKHGLDGKDYKEETRFTQECGSAAHGQLEALAKTGQPLDLSGQPERVRGALQAVAKWFFDHDPAFVESEVVVCSVNQRYAGRFDLLAEIGGELVLADLKTSDKEWHHFKRYKAQAAYAQLAGYAIAYRELYPEARQPTKRCVLHVNTDGEYDWMPDLAPEASEAAFLSKLATYRADQFWNRSYDDARKQRLAA